VDVRLAVLTVLLGACAIACAAEPDDAGDELVDEPAAQEPEPTEPVAATPVVEPQDDPPTSLPLTLLATQVADDPADGRATIRDDEAGAIASYRVGDPIRKHAIITAIERGRVRLVHDERRELLAVGIAPAALSADDVFYPDLVDEDLPDDMKDGVQLSAGPGWIIKRPHNAWGTPRTIDRLRDALREYVREMPGGPDVHVGDISRSGGGFFPPHLSHQAGRDVDIGYVLVGNSADVTRFVRAHAGNLDRERTWHLVRTLLESGAIGYVFMDYTIQGLLYEHAKTTGVSPQQLDAWFQYPRGNRAAHGVLRDWRGHDDHFHVRFTP
jgi:hypothetical protein